MLLLLVFHFKIWPKVLAWKIQTTFIRVLDYLNTNDYLNTILEVKSHWQYFYLVISDEFEPSWRLFSSARLVAFLTSARNQKLAKNELKFDSQLKTYFWLIFIINLYWKRLNYAAKSYNSTLKTPFVLIKFR